MGSSSPLFFFLLLNSMCVGGKKRQGLKAYFISQYLRPMISRGRADKLLGFLEKWVHLSYGEVRWLAAVCAGARQEVLLCRDWVRSSNNANYWWKTLER